MKQLLDVKDLHVKLDQVHAVRGIDFSLYEGEALAIVGESGCGKSAAAKALVRLHPKHSTEQTGKILYQEQNLCGLTESKLQKIRGKEIGMIFQDPLTSLNPTQKIGRQVIEGYLRHHPEAARQDAHSAGLEIMKKVGISDPEERMECYPHTLSGGMRQRIMIALALICKPKLLIADEPTTALDSILQFQILSLLTELRKKNNTGLILITHDMSLVSKFCDKVIVMYAGKIVESATVDKLFSNPQHPYTKQLLQTVPQLNFSKEHPLVIIEGQPPSLELPIHRCDFCSRCLDAMNICAMESPPLFATDESHASRCFRHDPRKKQ